MKDAQQGRPVNAFLTQIEALTLPARKLSQSLLRTTRHAGTMNDTLMPGHSSMCDGDDAAGIIG